MVGMGLVWIGQLVVHQNLSPLPFQGKRLYYLNARKFPTFRE